VKFNDLIKASKELGASMLATGHYIRKISSDNINQMHKALDSTKDQSYFLFATTQEQLDALLQHYTLDELMNLKSNIPEDDEIRMFSNFFESNFTLKSFLILN
jgi:tRNA-specific 2-thiouridylase